MRQSIQQFFQLILDVQAAVFEGFEVHQEEGEVEIQVRRRSNAKPRCPECSKVLGGEIRTHRKQWRHLNIIRTATFISSDLREGYCTRHGRRVESVPWAYPEARFTKVFDRQVTDLVQVADKSAASRMFGISWPTVGRMVKRVVDSELPRDRLSNLTHIGIDETSYKRGHRYITIVVNLLNGRVIWIGKDRSSATLNSFFDELGTERASKLEVVCLDMSPAFSKAVKERAPSADIVYDKFHVVQLLMEAVDDVRREEFRKVEGKARQALKGTRFALLRNPKHSKPKDEEKIALVKKTNRRLTRAYQLRVDFEELWEAQSHGEAQAFIRRWTRSALLSRLKPFRRFAKTIRNRQDGILAHFRHGGITNAQLEGTNNKIKLAIHKAYGFRSLPALMAMVYLCCGGIGERSGPGI
jgi:transposase